MELLKVHINRAEYESGVSTLEDIRFSIHSGELVGLIGPNGAGKSTTIKSILGLMKNMDGSILLPQNSSYSYIPERPIFYDELTLWEHMDFIAGVEELDQTYYRQQAATLLEQYKLTEVAHTLPATYSKGMQQKAMLVLALITNPQLYIIDEPFMGLDPMAMKLFLQSIEEERLKGAGILMSTHVLDTAEKVCDRFLLVNKGRLAAFGTLNEIRQACELPSASLFDCFHKIAEGQEK